MDCRHFSRAVKFRTFGFQVGLEKPQKKIQQPRPFSGPNNWPVHEVPELREVFEKNSVGEEVGLGVSKNGGTPKWMVYNGKLY